MAKREIITAARLREILNYDPLTGKFNWVIWGANYTRHPNPGGGKSKSICINYKNYSPARLAWLCMTGEWPSHQISFINRNTHDFRWTNLRLKKHSTSQLTAKELREILGYNPRTGQFWRRDPFWRNKKCGCVAKATGGSVITISVRNRRYLGHVLAWAWMTGKWPSRIVDHKNRIGTDNRWCNLRLATKAQNNWNSSRRRTNTSGYTGVHWLKREKRWMTFITVRFDKKQQAIDARKRLVKFVHGRFAATAN